MIGNYKKAIEYATEILEGLKHYDPDHAIFYLKKLNELIDL